MKASRMLIATLKEAPQEAIISSHILYKNSIKLLKKYLIKQKKLLLK